MISPTFQKGAARYTPVTARTTTLHNPVAALGHDCIKLIIVRDGTALLTERGSRLIARGNVVAINDPIKIPPQAGGPPAKTKGRRSDSLSRSPP